MRGRWLRAAGRAGLMLLLAAAGPCPGADPGVLLQARPGDDGTPPAFDDAARAAERAAMVREQVAGRGVEAPAVLDAMRAVPRHLFVPPGRRGAAYTDTPLPIGHGQTISQPYIVARMTELLRPAPGDRVLEIGTGSGYQAAILGQLVERVVSVEIIGALAEGAARRLRELGYGNITVLHGDGYYGHAPQAPYDAIVVTAAATHVPPPLVGQLRPGGRMVIPVGRSGWTQNLLLVEKGPEGRVSTRNLMAVRFVPLTGDH